MTAPVQQLQQQGRKAQSFQAGTGLHVWDIVLTRLTNPSKEHPAPMLPSLVLGCAV